MENLAETLSQLIEEHGIDAFMEAVLATGAIKKPLENPKPVCQPHYYWNGTACVPDVG